MRILLLAILLFSTTSEARIFRFADEDFAGYFQGSYGLSQMKDNAYANSSGTDTSFSEETSTIRSGELGISFNSKSIAILFGVEFLSPEKMEIIGSHSTSGDKLMDLTSTLRATIIKSTFLFPITMSQVYRSYISIYGGYAMLSMNNAYTLNADGIARYSSVAADYTEEAEAKRFAAGLNLGVEYNFSDTATIVLEGGYRYLPVDDWEYSKSDTGFTGAYNKGDSLVNHDGSKRSTDFSSVHLSLGFRFYVN